jgi:hypothetical protein
MAHKPDPDLEQAMLGKKPEPAPPAAEPAISPDVIALAKLLMAGQQETVTAMLAAQTTAAQAQADAMKTAMRPENTDPPLMSWFNPAGDRDHPRPALQCPFTLNGAEMAPAQLMVEEIELLNQLTPGHYRVQKTDGTHETVSVIPKVDSATGLITEMRIQLRAKDQEQAKNWPGMLTILAQMLSVPVPERKAETLPLGRITGPAAAGLAAGRAGMVQSLDEASVAALPGMVRSQVEAMLGRDADALAPSLA